MAINDAPLAKLIGHTHSKADYSADALVQRGYRADGVCFLVSRAYRFIYVKLAKTGSSSVVKILKAAVCGLESKGGSWDLKSCPDGSLLDHGQLHRDNATQMQCRLTPPSPSEWAQSFVFTIARSAAERRLSTVRYCAINDRRFAMAYKHRTSCERRCTSQPSCGI